VLTSHQRHPSTAGPCARDTPPSATKLRYYACLCHAQRTTAESRDRLEESAVLREAVRAVARTAAGVGHHCVIQHLRNKKIRTVKKK